MNETPNQPQPLTKTQRRELRRQEIDQHRHQQNRKSQFATWLWILVGVVVLAGLTYWGVMASRGKGNTNATGAANSPTLGGASASVVMTEFSDLSCPACATVAPTVRQLATAYGDKVKIVFRFYNIGHQWSGESLEAGECALAQGKFWEFADIAFAKQNEWETASNAVDLFKSYAKDAKVDTNAFNSCLDSGSMASAVQQDIDLGNAKGISSTPIFFINDQKVEGAKTLGEFKKIIDSELSKAPAVSNTNTSSNTNTPANTNK